MTLLMWTELFHHFGFVLALWLSMVGESVPEGGKGDPLLFAGLAYRLAVVDGCNSSLDKAFFGYSDNSGNKDCKGSIMAGFDEV